MSHPALIAYSPSPLLPQRWRRGVAVCPGEMADRGQAKEKEGLSAWGDYAGVGDWGGKRSEGEKN